MQFNPLVSIVVPCYNHRRFIEECLLCIMRQTYQNMQLIVFDDGSSDGSQEIIASLAKKHDFTFIPQQNQGHLAILNNALNNYVEGEYVCFVASDDYWPLDKIEQQVKYMQDHPECAMVCGNSLKVDEQSTPLEDVSFRPEHEVAFDDILLHNYIPALTAMLRTDVLKSVGGYRNDIITEDWYMWTLLLSSGYKIHYLGRLLGFYRVLSTSMSRNPSRLYEAQKKVLERFADHPLYRIKSNRLYDQYLVSSAVLANSSGSFAKLLLLLIKRKKIDKTSLLLLFQFLKKSA